MANLRMNWKEENAPRHAYMTDAQINLLANRYQANRICYLLDITFDAYLLAPDGWDRIAGHLNAGGGCRMVAGELVINKSEGGLCAWCERWWSNRAGGLDSNDLCPECARAYNHVNEASHA